MFRLCSPLLEGKKMNILETAEALIAPVFKAPNHSCFVCGITFHGAAIFRTQLDSNYEKVVMIEIKRENQWLVGGLNPSEKYESHLGWLFPIYGKIKNGNQTTNQMKITFPGQTHEFAILIFWAMGSHCQPLLVVRSAKEVSIVYPESWSSIHTSRPLEQIHIGNHYSIVYYFLFFYMWPTSDIYIYIHTWYCMIIFGYTVMPTMIQS